MLGFCRDPFITELNKLGYTLMPLAEAGVAPLDVYGRQRRELFRLGRAVDLFESTTVKLPEIEPDLEAGEVMTSSSKTLDGGLGAGIVSDWMGGEKAEISAKVKDLSKFSFQFRGLLKDRVGMALLDEYLASATMKANAPTLRGLLESDQVYIITSVLKATSVALISSVKQAAAAAAALPAAASLPVSGKAKVDFVDSGGTERLFKAKQPLVFAIQAAQICFLNGSYTTAKIDRTGLQLMSDDGLATNRQNETGWLCDELGSYFPRIVAGEASS